MTDRGFSPLGSTKDRKTLYNKGEAKLAKKVGGRRQPGSGAVEGFKGDVITQTFLIDQKTTEHTSFRLTAGVLNKITYEARQAGKHPAIEIEMEVAATTPKEWVLVPLDVFNEFRKMSDGLKEIKAEEATKKEERAGTGGTTSGSSSGDRTVPGSEAEAEEIEVSEEEKDARVGDTCYNTGDSGGIRFGF